MQTTFWCKPHLNLLKKFFLKKTINVHLSLTYLYTKFYDQIHLTLTVTKNTNFGAFELLLFHYTKNIHFLRFFNFLQLL
jgi:hypothetical protein